MRVSILRYPLDLKERLYQPAPEILHNHLCCVSQNAPASSLDAKASGSGSRISFPLFFIITPFHMIHVACGNGKCPVSPLIDKEDNQIPPATNLSVGSIDIFTLYMPLSIYHVRPICAFCSSNKRFCRTPFGVNRYFWLRARGFSGRVISMNPALMAG